MTLLELLIAVKEKNLSKDQLENYRDDLANLFAMMSLEIAEIEKEEAMYFYKLTNPQTTDVSIKRTWRATEKGQRQILLSRYLKASEKILASLRSRLYNVY